MTKHKHCDLIKLWADGAEIELYDSDTKTWHSVDQPMWYECTKYRIKSKWFDNIPEKGILCWVSSETKNPNSDNYIKIIISKAKEGGYYDNKYLYWEYATPLTKEEIMSYIYE